jgi:hypothetical protein
MVYISSGAPDGSSQPIIAIRAGARDDITPSDIEETRQFIAWSTTGGSYVPSAILYGGYYYTVRDRGFITCHEAETGKLVYGKQRIAVGATFSASPWAYNGKVFVMSEDGTTFVIESGRTYRLVAENRLDAYALASPAIAGGNVVIRTIGHLYAIRTAAALPNGQREAETD